MDTGLFVSEVLSTFDNPTWALVTLWGLSVRPEWVVIRWANGDCKIWHNDTNGPAGSGWMPVAFANTYPEAWGKMTVLYQRRMCV